MLLGQTQWDLSIIQALGRTKQRDYEFKASLEYTVQGQLVIKKMLLHKNLLDARYRY